MSISEPTIKSPDFRDFREMLMLSLKTTINNLKNSVSDEFPFKIDNVVFVGKPLYWHRRRSQYCSLTHR